MLRIHLPRRVGTIGLGLGLAVALFGGAGFVHAQARPDPVEELRKALRNPVLDTNRPEELTERRRELTRRIEALHGAGELRRALALQDWQDTEVDQRVAEIDRTARRNVAERLARLVQAMMHSPDAAGRLAAATLVAEIGITIRANAPNIALMREMAPDLVRMLERDPATEVRVAAARALGLITADPNVAVPALRRSLESDIVPVRRAAAAALGNMVSRITQIQPSKGKSITGVESTPGEVVRVATAVVPVAAGALNDSDVGVRRLAMEAIGQAAIALRDLVPSPESRRAYTITPLPPPGSAAARSPVAEERANVTPLARALSDPDDAVRLAARKALEDMADARLGLQQREGGAGGAAGGTAGGAEESEPPPQGAGRMDPLLGGLRQTLPALTRGLADPDVRVRRATLDALEEMGPQAAPAIGAVIRALDDPDMFVRWAAARTIGRIGPVDVADSVPALARLLRRQDVDVELTVAGVLARFGPAARAAVPALSGAAGRGDAETRVAALRALRAIGHDSREAIPAATAALADDDARVRRAAAEMLGSMGPLARSAVSALRDVLHDPEADVRTAASDAILSILHPSEERGR